MNFNLLKTFIKVAEFGSFTKAAHQLKQPKSRVSRSISRLEEELKAELIKRNTRSISLTDKGKTLYQETQSLIHELERAVESIADEGQEVSGTLSISAPIDFGEDVLPNLIGEFTQNNPQVDFRVLLSDSFVDLTANNIDVALRAGKLKDSSLKQKKITDTQFILVASANYLDLMGTPNSWCDIKRHKVLSYWNEIKLDPLDQMYQQYGFSPSVRANSFPMLKKLAIESKGIALLPNTMCLKEIKTGALVRVLPGWGHEKAPLQVVFSASKNLPKKTRAFIDFIGSKKDLIFS
ncbi:MAG: hypothetical protein CME64_10085 [Halobacteriovoraceae bacterium]|nr:hypothetical protein [Halobacteriovoraceae bacterium]|tara:strand:- start:105435 stop:106313 length:879 start_codon:yes stop_codon:yes gene_type:complete